MLQGQNDREALNKVVRDANSSTPKNKIIEMYICNRLSCYCLDKFITKVKKEMPEITEVVFLWEPISIAMLVRFRTPNFNFCIYSGRFDDKTSVMNDSVASFTRYGFYTYLEKNTDKGDIVRLTKSVRKTISELTVEYIKSMFAKQAEKK